MKVEEQTGIRLCDLCGNRSLFYWNTPTQNLRLCGEHYKAMELKVHEEEKTNRLVTTTFSVVSGKQSEFKDCPNGKDCHFCKEVGLT